MKELSPINQLGGFFIDNKLVDQLVDFIVTESLMCIRRDYLFYNQIGSYCGM